MADIGIKIPSLDQASTAAGEDWLVLVDVSADKTVKIAKNDFISDVGISLDGLSATTSSTPSGGGSMSYDNTTGIFTFTPADVPTDVSDLTDTTGLFASAASSALSAVTTTEVDEGTNLYFTPSRARESLNEGTGIEINYVNGEISIGQPVYTTSNPTFNSLTLNGTLTVNGQDLEQNINSSLASLDTDDVPEAGNLYHTTSRARGTISGGLGVDYDSSTGIIAIGQNVYTTSNPTFNTLTLTGDLIVNGTNINAQLSTVESSVTGLTTDNVSEGATNKYFSVSETRDSFSNGVGVTINKTNGTINIGQAVNTTSSPTFNNGTFNGNLTVGSISDVEAAINSAAGTLSALTTSSVTEDSNLYFTSARARTSVSGGTGVSYNSTTGVFSIGQAVNTTSNVRFNDIVVGGTLTVDGVNIADTLTGVQAQTSSLSTSSVAEGTNLYFTEGRARGSIIGGTGVSYSGDTGIIAIGQAVNTTSNVQFNNGRFNGTLSVGNVTDVGGVLEEHSLKFMNLDTDDVSEGSNEYFTEGRARSAISGGTGVSYNSTTGRVSIGQAVNTTSNVQFNNGNFNGNLSVSGTINGSEFPGTLAFPVGGIIMWSGSIASIPSGWKLCDGSNSTPDLRNRFVVGAGDDYTPGSTGGANEVSLTTNQMPNHSHSSGSLSTDTAGSHRHTIKGSTASNGPFSYQKTAPQLYRDDAEVNAEDANSMNYAGDHSHNISGTTGSTGNGNAHENRPPYYALAYIMKIA